MIVIVNSESVGSINIVVMTSSQWGCRGPGHGCYEFVGANIGLAVGLEYESETRKMWSLSSMHPWICR